jgi:hypothetical protein
VQYASVVGLLIEEEPQNGQVLLLLPVQYAGVAGLLIEEEPQNGQVLLLLPVQYAGVAGLLIEEEPQNGQVEDREPEADRCEVLVLLHEEVGPVTDVKVGHDQGQPGQGEEEVGQAVGGQTVIVAAATVVQAHLMLLLLVWIVGMPKQKNAGK